MAFLTFLKENYSHFQFEITGWYGGKSKIAPEFIHPEIIKSNQELPIQIYTEPFSGMFWAGLLLPFLELTELKTSVYNDLNDLNANLFLCLKHYTVFMEFLEQMGFENNRAVFDAFKRRIYNPNFHVKLDPMHPDFVTAYMYLYIMSNGYSGLTNERTTFKKKASPNGRFSAIIKKLKDPKWQIRLDTITHIGAMDYKEIIHRYDSPNTFHYIDSPYKGREHQYARNNFSSSSHEELKDVMRNVKGRFAISYYAFEELESFYPKSEYRWEKKEVPLPSSGKKGATATEVLIMNF